MLLSHLSSVIGSREFLAEYVLQVDRCRCILSLDTPPKWFLVGAEVCREEGGRESNSMKKDFERKRARWAWDERADLSWQERSMNMSKKLDGKKRISDLKKRKCSDK